MKQIRILLVEDNPGDAVLVQEIFDDLDVTIERLEHVTTLSAAIEKLKTNPFDAVILDLGLPDGFGIECIRSIREVQRDVPIVVLTGVDENRLAVACIAAGAHDYLRKSSMRARDLQRAVGFAMARSHELAERNRAHSYQMQRRALTKRIDSVREAERKRIAHAVHDEATIIAPRSVENGANKCIVC